IGAAQSLNRVDARNLRLKRWIVQVRTQICLAVCLAVRVVPNTRRCARVLKTCEVLRKRGVGFGVVRRSYRLAVVGPEGDVADWRPTATEIVGDDGACRTVVIRYTTRPG